MKFWLKVQNLGKSLILSYVLELQLKKKKVEKNCFRFFSQEEFFFIGNFLFQNKKASNNEKKKNH